MRNHKGERATSAALCTRGLATSSRRPLRTRPALHRRAQIRLSGLAQHVPGLPPATAAVPPVHVPGDEPAPSPTAAAPTPATAMRALTAGTSAASDQARPARPRSLRAGVQRRGPVRARAAVKSPRRCRRAGAPHALRRLQSPCEWSPQPCARAHRTSPVGWRPCPVPALRARCVRGSLALACPRPRAPRGPRLPSRCASPGAERGLAKATAAPQQ
mmetsp:Transcript_17336/g.40695  ORF Transcript_17336/g.40695 Transcript_17336/m.40695 type:complete len:216 (+) Transcript_17336:172-819(+)